ncbi:hypothetical protein [Streptosporangium sp. NPDC087985]|uniref:hypothetical protein n=1 Tax=Streptosporangium sp. NPDC087985 TaxID=3366196 RepID=UPI00380394BF
MEKRKLPELRQIVLLTGNLEGTLEAARSAFGVPHGHRDEEGMAAIGFTHEIFGFDRTYIEVCEPLRSDSGAASKLRKTGDSGFMIVVQVADSAGMVSRASRLGIEPLFVKDHHGSPISQWHPRDFGVLAEFDELVPPESWHFAPQVYAGRSTAVVNDIVSAHVSVPDPLAMAARWAAVVDAEVDGATVRLGDRTIEFEDVDGVRGLYAVDCLAAQDSGRGTVLSLCGVQFTLI